jgi:hypothetical protein
LGCSELGESLVRFVATFGGRGQMAAQRRAKETWRGKGVTQIVAFSCGVSKRATAPPAESRRAENIQVGARKWPAPFRQPLIMVCALFSLTKLSCRVSFVVLQTEILKECSVAFLF